MRYFLVVLAALIAACGGGGGGGGGDGGIAPPGGSTPNVTPLAFSGNASPAVVSALNAGRLTGNLTGEGDIAGATAALSGGATHIVGLLDVGRRLSRAFDGTLAKPLAAAPTAAVTLDSTDACSSSGSVRRSGTINDDGTGTLTVVFSDCRNGADMLGGQATMQVAAFDIPNRVPTDWTLNFPRLTLRGSANVDLTGSIRVQANVGSNTETITENVIALYAGSGHMTRVENLVYIDVYDSVLAPTSYVESVSGRIYDSVHGFVDVVTNAPFVFGSLTQEFPHGGELVLTGAGNAHIRATAFSADAVTLALDLDGDNAYERTARLRWTALSGPVGADLGDSDGDGMHNSWETAHGLSPTSGADASLDGDGDGQSNLAEYQAATDPTIANAPPPPPPIIGRVLTLAGNTDLIYDSFTLRLYAAVGGNPGSIVPIEPVSGTFGTAITVGNDPAKLALSDDGQYLYVGLNGESTVQRVEVAAPHAILPIPLATGTFGGRFAEDLAVLPGSPQSIAVSLKYNGVSPRHAGVAIFDGAVARSTLTPEHTGSNVIEFSASAATLYGYNNETTGFGFFRMAVDASGATVVDVHDSFAPEGALFSGFGVDMKFGGGLIFATTGAVVDPVARTLLGTVSLPVGFGNSVVADAALGRVFYLTLDPATATWSIRAFDMATRNLLGSGNITGVNGTPGSLVRWGTRGLAFRTSAGQIFLIESATLIP